MRGVKAKDLVAIVDFLYCGESNVEQEHLEVFLALADELRLKGLAGSGESNDDKYFSEKPPEKKRAAKKLQEEIIQNMPNPTDIYNTTPDSVGGSSLKMQLALVNVEPKKLDEQIKSIMDFSENVLSFGQKNTRGRICKACGKEGQMTDILRDIEATHIRDVSHACDICGKISRSRNGLRHHKAKEHRRLLCLQDQR